MTKYHLTPAGEPGPCLAKEKCPFGDAEHHYSTKAEARDFYENNAARILDTIAVDQKRYDETRAIFDQKSKELKKLQESFAKNKISDRAQAIEQLAQLEEEIYELTNETRLALNKVRLSKREGYKSGLLVREPVEEIIPSTEPSNRPAPANSFDSMTPATKRVVVAELANWAGMTLQAAEQAVDSYELYKSEAEKAGQVPLTQDEYVLVLFQETMTEDKHFAYIDLETTSFTPASGEVIEIGIVVVDKDGNVVKEIDERFDMEDPTVRDVIGTGHVDVHKITPKDIVGKRRFTDEEVQTEVGSILNDRNTVMVAHNAMFERRFLNHYLKGFRSARDPYSAENLKTGQAAAPVQDTQIISRFLNHNTTGNTLRDFAESNGIKYVDAHSAFPDAAMTHKALAGFREAFKATPPGERPALEGLA